MINKLLKKLTTEQAENAVVLYDSGSSLGQIAAQFGVSRQAMWDLLRRRTQMRPQRRSGKENHFYRGGIRADEQAQNDVENALKRGAIIRKDKCETCGDSGTFKDGRSKIQAHHCDYNKPLDVIWLCQHCHHEWHKHNTAIPKNIKADRGN